MELTLALHNVLDFPEDKLIWDGTSRHTHKILAGRKDEFKNLRQEGGLSGFPKRSESPVMHDAGHSSIQFRQDWDMCMPEIFWDRSIMWFL